MYTKAQCEPYVGKWVHFRTKYGYHVGMIERVTDDSAIVLSPRKYIPTQLASSPVSGDDAKRLDLALAWGGYGGWGGAPGAGAGAWGGRAGYPGWGWGWGWGRWAVSFLIIYVLWGLWWW